ncbi:hypothetical protein [Hymenobacter sp. DG01]|uniref:hypothetical protein n=1 Tax=Hymenobacter sp. DG01 TaxID=2584940 RepID=UPI001120C7BB|nr:hypothetical protein [Hymenobacter sp. DG01]
MTHETLHSVLARANGGDGPEILILRPLTESVVWASLWLEAPRPDQTDRRQHGSKVYLIRNELQEYVGIVLDHGPADLHVYVPPQHRGHHYMSKALREVILPHLFLDGREVQHITISRNFGRKTFEAAQNAALAAGFVPVHRAEDEEQNIATLEFTPVNPDDMPYYPGTDTEPSAERLQQIKRQLAYHASCLQLLSDEVAMHLADDFLPEEIEELAIDVHGLYDKIQRAVREMKER